jgi:ubiquinone/menaquinone biosynthesis C-methylase UbiE
MLLGRFFAATYDRGARRSEDAGLRDRRHALLDGLQGDVLEIGAGTGLNLEHYPEGVRLVLLEPDLHMSRKLEERVSGSGRHAEIVAAPAEALPFADASFDAVVTTLVLCSVTDLGAALAEIRRVLRPGGRLLLIEHVRGARGRAVLQDAIAPASRLLVSCSPNRRTAQAVREAGFELDEEPFQLLGAPPWIRPAFRGVAVKRST